MLPDELLSTVVLLGMTLVAAVTDVLRRKIYNWNTYSGMLAAIAMSAAGSIWLRANSSAEARAAKWIGGPTFGDCLRGLLACGVLLVICYVFFRGIRGGDVKLMAMIGALMGVEKGLEALLWTFVLTAALGLVVLVWKVGPLTTVSRAVRSLAGRLRLGWFSPLSDAEREAMQSRIFLGPGALAAVIIVRFGLIT